MNKIVAGALVIIGTALQMPALGAIPVGMRDQYIGSGLVAWAWIIGWMMALLVGVFLIWAGTEEQIDARRSKAKRAEAWEAFAQGEGGPDPVEVHRVHPEP